MTGLKAFGESVAPCVSVVGGFAVAKLREGFDIAWRSFFSGAGHGAGARVGWDAGAAISRGIGLR